MTKKINVLLPLLIILPCLSGCKGTEKSILTFGRINAISATPKVEEIFDPLAYGDLESKIANKESLLLVTAKKKPSCTCFNDFKGVINSYNKQYHGLFYLINHEDFSDKDSFGLSIPTSDTVTFSIFSEGKLTIQYVDGGKNDSKLFTDVNVLRQEIQNRINDPIMYYVDQKTLDTKIESKENFLIYLKKSGCPDCEKAEPTTIYPYMLKNQNVETLFIFDIKPYIGTEEYQSIKDKYFLSTKNNKTYGYGDGVFPTLFKIESGKPIDGMVFFNDEIINKENKYTISNSYYSKERIPNLKYLDQGDYCLIDKTLEEKDVGSYIDEEKVTHYYWKNDSSLTFYSKVFTLFANKYIKNTVN